MSEQVVYTRPSGIYDGAVTGFCPGCLHSAAVKTILEVDLVPYLSGLKKLIVPFVRPKNPAQHRPAGRMKSNS